MSKELWVFAVLAGITATAVIDLWAGVLKYGFHLPTTDWAMVGRWFGYLPRGVLIHHPIGQASPVRHERLVGWVADYAIGIMYALTYLYIVVVLLFRPPSFLSALVFVIATVAAPWLVMLPGLGLGFFARRIPNPSLIRFISLSVHLLFGASLLFGWWLVALWV